MRRLNRRFPAEGPVAFDRREILGAVAGWLALGVASAGCSGDRDAKPLGPGQVAVPLADLKPGVRTTVLVAGNPVELLRSGDTVTARMLRCTHMGCVVRWKEADRAYLCPCHDGRYDEAGNVIAGPPALPLWKVNVAVSGGRVIVG